MERGRDTLAFDEVLYRDRFLRVTPAELVLAEYARPLGGPQVVLVDDVEAVGRAGQGAPPPPRRRWWMRCAPLARVAAALGLPAPPPPAAASALLIRVAGRQFRVSCAGPVDDALRAVQKARAIAV